VGLTRASRQIFLTAARTRIFWGKTRKMQPSPFLEDMGRLLVREEARPPRKRKKRPAQKKLF
jgi:superfamily I DNA/RNA helicase